MCLLLMGPVSPPAETDPMPPMKSAKESCVESNEAEHALHAYLPYAKGAHEHGGMECAS